MADKNINYMTTENTFLDKYELEFHWIPSLVEAFKKGDVRIPILTDTQKWKWFFENMGISNFDFSFEDIMVQHVIFEDGTNALLYIFPEPDMMPLAKYGIIILEKKRKRIYVTLERHDSIHGTITWCLCSQTSDKHENFGQVHSCESPDEFKIMVEKRFGYIKKKRLFCFFKH